jgi:hypothetical protein
LIVVVTCDSLVLAARIARTTNTIAGYRSIEVSAALDWSSVFYHFLARDVLSRMHSTARNHSRIPACFYWRGEIFD